MMRATPTASLVGATAILLALSTSCSSSSTPASGALSPSTTGTQATNRAGGTSGPATTASTAPSRPASTGGTPSPQGAPPATEFNPPGDIPDNQVFVDYQVPGSTVHIKVPEGWSRSSSRGTTTFTDHYNSIAIEVVPRAKPPTVTTAQQVDVPQLRRTAAAFAHGSVSAQQRQHGKAVLLTYFLDSAPSPVTGKVVRDAAERYEFWHRGQEAVLTLTGPKGADNVDPWRLVSDSLRWG